MAPTCLSGSRGFIAPRFLWRRQPEPRDRKRRGVSCIGRSVHTDSMDKADIRARMRARRKLLHQPDTIAAISACAGALPAGGIVALYRSIGAEVPTDGLAAVLLACEVTLCLPVVVSRDEAMVFRLWMPGDPLEEDQAGCPAPLDLAGTVTPDLVVTPLVAFDARGYRLGQGGGFYDRTFAVLPDAVRVGLAFAGQEVDQLPAEAHDIRLHGVLTENGYRAFP